jgi:hypothetical protein
MSAPHPIIQKAFLIESLFNFLSFPLITNTSLVLSYILKNPSQINPSTILFTRLFGGLIVGVLTPLLIFGLRTPETRKIVYISLGLGEGLLIPLLLGEAFKDGGVTGLGKALTKGVALGAVGMLAPPCLWRVYCLGLRPELFRDVKVGKNGKTL